MSPISGTVTTLGDSMNQLKSVMNVALISTCVGRVGSVAAGGKPIIYEQMQPENLQLAISIACTEFYIPFGPVGICTKHP